MVWTFPLHDHALWLRTLRILIYYPKTSYWYNYNRENSWINYLPWLVCIYLGLFEKLAVFPYHYCILLIYHAQVNQLVILTSKPNTTILKISPTLKINIGNYNFYRNSKPSTQASRQRKRRFYNSRLAKISSWKRNVDSICRQLNNSGFFEHFINNFAKRWFYVIFASSSSVFHADSPLIFITENASLLRPWSRKQLSNQIFYCSSKRGM